MADPTEAEKRRREQEVAAQEVHERDPAPLGDDARPYDPDSGDVGTTRPRSVAPMGSAGPTGVVPPKAGAGPQWKRPALVVGAVLLVIVLLLILT